MRIKIGQKIRYVYRGIIEDMLVDNVTDYCITGLVDSFRNQDRDINLIEQVRILEENQ